MMFQNDLFETLRSFGENPNLFLAQAAKGSITILSAPSGFGFFVLRLLFILLGLILFGLTIYFLRNTTYLRFLVLQDLVEFFTYRPYGAKRMNKAWNKILQRLETGNESEYKLAIVEADDLLNSTLERMGYAGEDLESRLANLTAIILPGIQDVKEAHRIRNNIVHDPDYRLSLHDARNTIEIYEKALKDLQVLE